MKTNVYEQELTSRKFLYQSDLPTLTSLTVCFWLKLINNGNGYYPIIFSVATPGWWHLSYPHFDKSTLCLLEMLPSDVYIGEEVSIIKTRVQWDEFKGGYLETRLGWWHLSYPHFDKYTLPLLKVLPNDVYMRGITDTRVLWDSEHIQSCILF